MTTRPKLSASFKRHYWLLVEECVHLFPEGAASASKKLLQRVRRGASDAAYHLEPIDAAKLVLGLSVVPDEVAKQYRAGIQRRFAALGD